MALSPASAVAAPQQEAYEEYVDFFEKVFDAFQKNYYKHVPRSAFNRFILKFKKKIYPQLKATGKSIDFVRWRSAAYMVEFLRDKEDIFSAFYPPQPAKDYAESSLGKRIDLGIEGKLLPLGFRVSFVEPRSDAYAKGLRENDLIVRIGDKNVAGMKEAAVKELLTPLANTSVVLSALDGQTRQPKELKVQSEEYFKQTVFDVPLPVPHIYCLRIEHFNRKTAEDMLRYLQFYRRQGDIEGLILDLRGNPGGPPLAAREIASFFLKPGSEFAYFKKQSQPKTVLDVPTIPEAYRYSGPIVILINQKSGSASELFSGVLQKRGRAVLMGEHSAGQVMLKSMFPFDDKSMLLLVVARGHYPDGSVFSFKGLQPDKYFSEDKKTEDILKFAATYLLYVHKGQKKL